MSLEGIDDKFEDVAKSFSSKQEKKTEPAPNKSEVEKETTYEESVSQNKLSPLLSMFEEHLRRQASKTEETPPSDDEFRTINVGELQTIPSTESDPREQEVTEEEIESLLKFSKPNVSNIKKETTVSDVVYSQKRYGDQNPPPTNVARADDLSVAYEVNSIPAGGPDLKPQVEDTNVGLKPVNFSEKYKKEQSTPQQPTSVEPVTQYDNPNDGVPEDVMEHIKNHKKKKQISETDNTVQDKT